MLEKKLKIQFYNNDVYVNVVGGLSLEGTISDLGVALALISSINTRPIKLEKSIIVGEVGLTGEIRPVNSIDRLVKEAEKMGFEKVVLPNRNKEKIKGHKINLIGVNNLIEAINKLF